MCKLASGAALALLLLACSPPPPGDLPPPAEDVSAGLRVTPGIPQGWVVDLTGATAAARFVPGPGSPPSGLGSVELVTGTDGSGGPQLRHAGFAGRLLSSLTELTYFTHVTQNVNCQAPYLALDVDTNGDGAVDDALFFEPCYQTGGYSGDPVPNQGQVTLGVWQRWDALAGGWWADSGGTPGPPLTTLASNVRAHPTATIVNATGGKGGVRLAAGFGAPIWDNFIGHADALTIGIGGHSTFYDFEPQGCQPHGTAVIDITQHVRNDVDSGVAGNDWAYDAYGKRIQVWADGTGGYCARVGFLGSFDTVAGKSPAGTGMIRAGIRGALTGIYSATLDGMLNPAPGYPSSGDLGTFDYRCDAATGICPGLFDWVKIYFNPGTHFAFNYWIWTYLSPGHGFWINASGGNLGDIHN